MRARACAAAEKKELEKKKAAAAATHRPSMTFWRRWRKLLYQYGSDLFIDATVDMAMSLIAVVMFVIVSTWLRAHTHTDDADRAELRVHLSPPPRTLLHAPVTRRRRRRRWRRRRRRWRRRQI